MSSHAARQGMTLREACVLITGMLGQPTAREIHEFLAADGWHVTLGTVKQALYAIRGGPVQVTKRRRGYRQGRRFPDRWRQSEAGRAWVTGFAGGERCGA